MTGKLIAIAMKSAPRQPMKLLDRAGISVESGVAGDFRGQSPGRQVTIVFVEDWTRAVASLDPSAPWTIRRANLLVGGIVNPRAEGGLLAIGPVRLEITGETHPCNRMEQQLPGLRAALTPDWLGGLTANVIEGGEIAVGDEATWVA